MLLRAPRVAPRTFLTLGGDSRKLGLTGPLPSMWSQPLPRPFPAGAQDPKGRRWKLPVFLKARSRSGFRTLACVWPGRESKGGKGTHLQGEARHRLRTPHGPSSGSHVGGTLPSQPPTAFISATTAGSSSTGLCGKVLNSLPPTNTTPVQLHTEQLPQK